MTIVLCSHAEFTWIMGNVEPSNIIEWENDNTHGEEISGTIHSNPKLANYLTG